MTPYESLRASDRDREAIADRLRQAAAEGRLEPEELEERLEVALRARTYGELSPLVADLPEPGGALPSRRSAAQPVARVALVGAGALTAALVAVAVVALVVVALAITAAWWMAAVLFWLLCCGPRRRLMWHSAWRHRTRVHRARPTGLL
jgi:hypothetical protein